MKNSLLILFLLLGACSKSLDSLEPKAEQAVSRWACQDLQSSLFDVAYAAFIDLQIVPTKEEFVQLFEKSLAQRKTVDFDQQEFLQNVGSFYEVILSQSHNNRQIMLQKVAAAELGSQEDAEAQQVQRELQVLKKKWSEVVVRMQGRCASTLDRKDQVIKSPQNSVSFGAQKTLAVAYQSCESLRQPAMVLETPDTQGIAIVGNFPDGVGKMRLIEDLPSFLASNYYLQNFIHEKQCRDIRQSPLIYDYGGKPYAPTSQNVLDLFTNGGEGTSALGIDCSGYVFSAIATAGLKLDPGKKMKPVLVNGINAALYKEPEKNGMPCLEKVKMGISGNLKAGDIAAKVGHVFVIESVGTDPLGLEKAKTLSQCDQLTSRQFDFVVAQSSPSKGGIGINKFSGRDYLEESSSLRAGFEKYAREACKARFRGKDVQISGQDLQLVRHKLTPECLDEPIQLVGESCVEKCIGL